MILCADDYGISPAVSEGILELIQRRRISSVSCMTVGPQARTLLEQLTPFRGQIEMGLHIVLTNSLPLSALDQRTGLTGADGHFFAFPKLCRRSFQGRINRSAVHQEISAQLNMFQLAIGSLPDYLDGHQHVQQLPIIRDAVISCAQTIQSQQHQCYVRVASPLFWDYPMQRLLGASKLAVANLGLAIPGSFLRRLLDRRGILHNRNLLGFYYYEDGSRFADVFRDYLATKPGERDVFFCHPGYVDDELCRCDPVTASRVDVLRFLQSSQALDLLQQSGTKLNTFFGAAYPEASR